MAFFIFILISVIIAVSTCCLMKFLSRNNNSTNDDIHPDVDDLSYISDPKIREIIKQLKEEAKSECIFDFFKGIDFKAIPDSSFTEAIGKNIKGEEVKEYSKQLDQKILDLFDELVIQFDGSKRHYGFSGSHEKPPIRELRTAAWAFEFKYGANVDGKGFDQKDESRIARGETWRSVWNITKQEKKAFALTWDSKEKKARLTIMDYSDKTL